MPRMRGRLYSSCASSTWSLPSALTGVLGEDVEDQLRAVDDARLERVLERPLLGRVELVVDEQHLGAATRRTRASAPRACPCRRTCAGRAARGAGRARRPARRRRSARARGARRARRRVGASGGSTATTKPRSGSAPAADPAGAVSRVIMPRAAGRIRVVDFALARATLELVDIPSESRTRQELGELVAARVPLGRSRYDDGETLLFATGATAPARRPRRPPRHGAGEQGNLPGRIEDGAVHGLGASDMKGGLAVMIELARWIAATARARARRRLPLLPARGARRSRRARCRASSTAGLVDDAGARGRARADRQRAPGRLPREPQRASSRFAARARTRRGRGSACNAIDLAVEGLAPSRAGCRRTTSRSRAAVPRGAEPDADRGRDRADNVVPTSSRRRSTSATRRTARRRRPRRGCASSSRRRRGRDHEPLARRAGRGRQPARPAAARAAGFAVEPKQAWTPVAEFAERGLDAVNFGPGATRYAHTRDEQVEIAALERCVRRAPRFLTA